MSGPGGTTTNRDRRREARRQQLQQRQTERRRARERQIRVRRVQRGGLIGAGVLLIALLVLLVAHLATASPGASAGAPTIDGMRCEASVGGALHIHAYLAIYVNGQPQQVPAGVGIDSARNCLYPLHVHAGEPNVIHIESNTVQTYTLGEFFDVWHKPLSASQVEGYTGSASKPLTVEVTDASGHFMPYTGNSRGIPLSDHETIAILYNSPNVTPKPFTNWTTLQP